VTRQEASEYCGITLTRGGWYFPDGGWLNPALLCKALLAGAGNALTCYFQRTVSQLVWHDGERRWLAIDSAGNMIAKAPVVMLANANGAKQLLDRTGLKHIQTHRLRGQISLLNGNMANQDSEIFTPHIPRIPIVSNSYVIPAGNGQLLTGASYDKGNLETLPCPHSHAKNIRQIKNIFPSMKLTPDCHDLSGSATSSGWVGFRCVTKDRLPFAGKLVDEASAYESARKGAQLSELPRIPGLFSAFGYGSRGLAWAHIVAESIASALNGEPLPVERALASAADPARFFLRAVRQGKAG